MSTHKKIRKAVIPAAGFGTRFLPQTKAMPKEMLPIVDKPVIQYVVEEAVASGIKDIIIVTGAQKRAIEDHFDVLSAELTHSLETSGKLDILKENQAISEMANFIYIRQKGLYGNGTPVLSAEPAIEDEFFAVLWGDEFIHSHPPRLAQMLAVHEKYGGAVISGVRIEKKEDLRRYGIAAVDHIEGNVYQIKKIVEKPEPDQAPSNLATHGAYILPPEIFNILRNQQPGTGGEIYLPEAIDQLIATGYPVYTAVIENGHYYDTGNKIEYLKTVIDFALARPDLGPELRDYLEKIIKEKP
jgi:UTP--glucose-1-phosphate uridylyltransferase